MILSRTGRNWPDTILLTSTHLPSMTSQGSLYTNRILLSDQIKKHIKNTKLNTIAYSQIRFRNNNWAWNISECISKHLESMIWYMISWWWYEIENNPYFFKEDICILYELVISNLKLNHIVLKVLSIKHKHIVFTKECQILTFKNKYIVWLQR